MGSRVTLLVVCGFMAAVSTPLILRLIGPNSIYGFRTSFTLSSPDIWYPANVFAGWALLIAASVTTTALWLLPSSVLSRTGMSTFLLLGPIALAVIASALYIRRLG